MHLELLKQNIVTLIWQKMSSLITTGTSNGGLDPNHLKSASESSFRWVLVWPLVESIVNMICGASKSIGNVEKVTIQKSELCQMKNIEQILFLIYWRARTFGETMSRKQTLFCPKIPNMQYTDTLNESYTYQRRKQFLSIFHSCNNIKVFSWLTLVCSIRPVTSEVIGFPRSYNNPLEDDAYTGRIRIEKKKYNSFHL